MAEGPAHSADPVPPPAKSDVMRRYVAQCGASLAILAAVCAGFCAAVDPYAVFGMKLIAGFNRDKPAAADWPWLTKAYTAPRVRPRTILLGVSTSDVGFNPDSSSFTPAGRPVFNLAIDGGQSGDLALYLRHVMQTAKPARVIVAMGFIDTLIFVPKRMLETHSSGFDFTARLARRADGSANPDYTAARLADIVFATLSLDAVKDSITTVLEQGDPWSTYETANGWNNGAKFRRWARDDGYYGLILNKLTEKVPQLHRWRSDKRQNIQGIFDVVRMCRQNGIAVTVALLPSHADLLEAVRQAGLSDDKDVWTKGILDGVRAIAPDGSVPVWDFDGYTPYTTEAVPAPQDRTTKLHWFYEPLHFQPALGDLLLARMNGAAAPADLGVALTPQTLPGFLAHYHATQATWVASHPADVARIKTLMDAVQD